MFCSTAASMSSLDNNLKPVAGHRSTLTLAIPPCYGLLQLPAELAFAHYMQLIQTPRKRENLLCLFEQNHGGVRAQGGQACPRLSKQRISKRTLKPHSKYITRQLPPIHRKLHLYVQPTAPHCRYNTKCLTQKVAKSRVTVSNMPQVRGASAKVG